MGQLIPHVTHVPFIGRTKLLAKRGWAGVTGNIYTGLHDFHEMMFVLHLLKMTDLFVDVGANVGAYTILAAGVNEADVLAFEPSSINFDRLSANVRLNKLVNRVKLYKMGLGANKDLFHITSTLDTNNHVTVAKAVDGNTEEIPFEALDNLLDERKPVLIKIDVEGFETEVLRGMQTTLTCPTLKGIIIELNGNGYRYGFKDNDIHEVLVKHDFYPYGYDPFSRRLKRLETFGKFNTIYCRDIPFLQARLDAAKKIKIFSELI